MASQNNPGQQFDRDDVVTVTATARVEARRFIAYGGTHATSAGLAFDAQGIGQSAGDPGDAIPVTTSYSDLVECSEPIALFAYVKPAADGSGRAAVGTLADHCGRALGATNAAGQVLEVQVVRHVHA